MEISEERDGIVAATKDILEKLLDLMGITAQVTPSDDFPVEVTGPVEEVETISPVVLDIKGEDLGILIGRRGQTLTSLQYIVRLIVSTKTQTRLPLIIDVEGYKRHRCESLRALALRLAEEVKVSKAPFTMEPMPPFERRIIHVALADSPDVTTESTGFGEERKVVIMPRKPQAD